MLQKVISCHYTGVFVNEVLQQWSCLIDNNVHDFPSCLHPWKDIVNLIINNIFWQDK